MRLKHLALQTEQTYLNRMRQFYRHVNGVALKDLNSQHVTDFLTFLAVERKVARSTQNQAFSALLFFYRHALKKEVGDIWQAMRARPRQRVPVVLSANEIQRIMGHLQGLQRLRLQVIYGGGLKSS